MEKEVNIIIKTRGESIFKGFRIYVSTDYKTYIFKSKGGHFPKKKLHVREDGLYDLKHPKAKKGEPKLVTKYNSMWVYALDKFGKKEGKINGIPLLSGWVTKSVDGYCYNKKNCKVPCQVRSLIAFKDYTYANFVFHSDYLIDEKVEILKETRIYTTKYGWATVKEATENWFKKSVEKCRQKHSTKSERKRRDSLIRFYSSIGIPNSRLQEMFELSQRRIYGIIMKDKIIYPKKKKEGN